jgi:hypothetical protein
MPRDSQRQPGGPTRVRPRLCRREPQRHSAFRPHRRTAGRGPRSGLGADLLRSKPRALSADDEKWLKSLPIKEVQKRNNLPTEKDRGRLHEAVLTFFGVADRQAWERIWRGPVASFRRSRAFANDPGAVVAWLRIAQLEARKVKVAPFSASGFRKLLREVRSLTAGGRCQSDCRTMRQSGRRRGVRVRGQTVPGQWRCVVGRSIAGYITLARSKSKSRHTALKWGRAGLEPATNGFAKRRSRRPLSDTSIILYDNTIRDKKAPCPYPLLPADSRSLSMNKR